MYNVCAFLVHKACRSCCYHPEVLEKHPQCFTHPIAHSTGNDSLHFLSICGYISAWGRIDVFVLKTFLFQKTALSIIKIYNI